MAWGAQFLAQNRTISPAKVFKNVNMKILLMWV